MCFYVWSKVIHSPANSLFIPKFKEHKIPGEPIVWPSFSNLTVIWLEGSPGPNQEKA